MLLPTISVARQSRPLFSPSTPVVRQLQKSFLLPSSPVVRQLRDSFSLHSSCLDSEGQSGCLEIRPRNIPVNLPHSSSVGACITGGLWGSISPQLHPTVVRENACPTDNKSLHPIWPPVKDFARCSRGEAKSLPGFQTGELNRYTHGKKVRNENNA